MNSTLSALFFPLPALSETSHRMAGHSAWKNIKHRKAAVDKKRGKVWSKCSRAIIVTAQKGGGDPHFNPSLRIAIDAARAVNMPRDTIEKAIKKGTGEGTAEQYESARYEGYAPGGVALIVECLISNANKAAADIRVVHDVVVHQSGQVHELDHRSHPHQFGLDLARAAPAAEERQGRADTLAGSVDAVVDHRPDLGFESAELAVQVTVELSQMWRQQREHPGKRVWLGTDGRTGDAAHDSADARCEIENDQPIVAALGQPLSSRSAETAADNKKAAGFLPRP